MKRRSLLAGLGGLALAAPAVHTAKAQVITLNGASQFNDDHPFTKAMVRFEERVKALYGKPINFVLHKNSSLGLEKQYFEYMAQGRAVDYAIVSPAHMSTFSRAAPFIDAPFLFADLAHWNRVLDADMFKPVADEVAQRAQVMLIGYAGGGVRNIFANKVVRNMAELRGLKIRVQGAPIWSLAPNLIMTQHAITIRPLCFSSRTFARLPDDLKAAIMQAGKEGGAHGRQVESSEDEQKLVALESAGRLKRIPFEGRAEMKKLVDPVMATYAREIGAEAILGRINGLVS
ncbi:MAG: TRAP transporter substrate-binding protein [Acetobacteraceae bacterium]|nr:TRAP transporter substrate-binding protein [Acetobacteraceae bacterium]